MVSTHRQICLCIAAALLTLTAQPSSLQQLVQSLSHLMAESAGSIYLLFNSSCFRTFLFYLEEDVH